jgi:hypothetical protein
MLGYKVPYWGKKERKECQASITQGRRKKEEEKRTMENP